VKISAHSLQKRGTSYLEKRKKNRGRSQTTEGKVSVLPRGKRVTAYLERVSSARSQRVGVTAKTGKKKKKDHVPSPARPEGEKRSPRHPLRPGLGPAASHRGRARLGEERLLGHSKWASIAKGGR